jgi:hypothetical protein
VKETIEWIDVKERLPELDTTVLVFVPTSESEPVWPGSHDGGEWLYADGSSVDGPVTHWAEMPAGLVGPSTSLRAGGGA